MFVVVRVSLPFGFWEHICSLAFCFVVAFDMFSFVALDYWLLSCLASLFIDL